MTLPPASPPRPPLIARLVAIPTTIAKPVQRQKPHKKPRHIKTRRKQRHKRQAKHVKPIPPARPTTPPAIAKPVDTAAQATPLDTTNIAPSTQAIDTTNIVPSNQETDNTADSVWNNSPAYPLPKHAQLTYVAYLGTNFPVGKVTQQLDIKDDQSYTLQERITTVGLASFFKTFDMKQRSTGRVTAQGLRPDNFTENKVTDDGEQTLSAAFDWKNKQLYFSNGSKAALPEKTQDLLSFLYQFSQIPLDRRLLPMHVSNGKKLENYDLEVGAEEQIITRMGKLRVLPLRKIHGAGEEGLEVWLALEYRLLPVKISQIDRKGEIAGQLVITKIQVSDE
ncbi:MAG: DUF3108 domain-containing protein [Gallionella sp.]